MYTLTLTKHEREAFDWVGYRSAAGEISSLLSTHLPPDQEWYGHGDITIQIPEWTAWEIDKLARDEEYTWPHFGPGLKSKLNTFCNSIV